VTFRFVAQRLNHCATAVPLLITVQSVNLPSHLSDPQNLFLHSSSIRFQPLCGRLTGAIIITDLCATILCLSAPFCAVPITSYTITLSTGSQFQRQKCNINKNQITLQPSKCDQVSKLTGSVHHRERSKAKWNEVK